MSTASSSGIETASRAGTSSERDVDRADDDSASSDGGDSRYGDDRSVTIMLFRYF